MLRKSHTRYTPKRRKIYKLHIKITQYCQLTRSQPARETTAASSLS